MAFGVRPRYYCTNVAGGCRHAKADTPFSASELASAGGVCGGVGEQGCGLPLTPGEPLDLRARWAAAGLGVLLCVVVAGWGVRQAFFPPALSNLDFAAPRSETVDSVGLLAIDVVRSADTDRAVTVEYAATDGSAKAGQDYSPVQGKLEFAAGERRKTLSVPLLPDPSFQKERRYFSLSLLNVRDAPKHVVYIVPRSVASNDSKVAEQSVRAASITAKDLADFVVRQRTLDALLRRSRENAGEFREYQQLLGTVNGNLTRARESYMQMLQELKTQQPTTVLGAMDRVAADLERRGFGQQGQAVVIMKRQFTELLNNRGADMDRWAQELSVVVPRVGGKASPSV